MSLGEQRCCAGRCGWPALLLFGVHGKCAATSAVPSHGLGNVAHLLPPSCLTPQANAGGLADCENRRLDLETLYSYCQTDLNNCNTYLESAEQDRQACMCEYVWGGC